MLRSLRYCIAAVVWAVVDKTKSTENNTHTQAECVEKKGYFVVRGRLHRFTDQGIASTTKNVRRGSHRIQLGKQYH